MNAPFSPGRGFSDPVHGAQAFFRAILTAMSGPGQIVAVPDMGIQGPQDLPKEALGILLAMCDHETPVWLDEELRCSQIADWLAFHAHCEVVAEPARAVFGILREGRASPDLSEFALGDERYPDRSTTLIVLAQAFTGGMPLALEGPGIKSIARLAPLGLPENFLSQMKTNHSFYPRGVDVLILAEHGLCGLPRSTRILKEPC